MAKKISNFVYALMFGIFVFSALSIFVYNTDSLFISNEGIGNILNDVGENASGEYLDTEETVYESTFETGTFSLPETQNVETRGTTQGIILAKNNPSTATSSLKTIFGYVTLHPLLTGFIISLIIITSTILVIRLFLGDGRS